MNRRRFLAGSAASAGIGLPALARVAEPFRLGLTPVFLDNDAVVIERLRSALSQALGEPVDLIQRRTYQEITASLLDGSVDAAWICGYPFLQHGDSLSLLGVPVWRGRPLYQSYLIVRHDDAALRLEDLRGDVHAFSDPDSNSGYLVTASDIARLGETPERFFSRSIFTYGHRNVVRAVAGGLTRSGSVDGYVWETLARVEPSLTERTRVVTQSEWLGFPPFAARADRATDPLVRQFGAALRGLDASAAGRDALRQLFLDRVQHGDPGLFDGIAARMAEVPRR
ncbi:PhnD/SsuA/transferrin family substrate-binding protein [Roseivivax isoporae]|uniref:Phosphonate ABC transporter substrate-binding protein n=1 Tax=Roseivivax isoporae LMG 25204 TaxID=1449351 RepID=X7F2X1_9RHOB|nr:PhnD/SsuA/transferrin family substrate-binding protein [Roseivivax isoporae]ETX27058.1 phosphonate ABC transporter substrate-binding protein [Roseivivax isoporae LMG 25204]